MKSKEELIEEARKEPHYKTYENIGKILMEEGYNEDAILYLSAAAGLGNKQSKARYLLAQCLIKIGEYGDAAVKLKEALEMNPNYKSAAKLFEQLLVDHPRISEEIYIDGIKRE